MVTLYHNNQIGVDHFKSNSAAGPAAAVTGSAVPGRTPVQTTMAPRVGSSTSLASAVSEASSHAEGERVRIRFSFGGAFSMAPSNGSWRYQGGNMYLESLPLTCTYSELMFLLSEKVQNTVTVKYQIPGEELDPDQLISVCDDGDLQEMYDEYVQGLSRPGTPAKTFRLRIFLIQAEEQVFVPKGSRRSSANGHEADLSAEDMPDVPASSLSSIGSNGSAGSLQSSASKMSRSTKGAAASSGQYSLTHQNDSESPTSAAAAAWEEGFRAGQDASTFQEECNAFMWQELLVSKLSRATKHCSFTAEAWGFEDADDEADDVEDLLYHQAPFGDPPTLAAPPPVVPFGDAWHHGYPAASLVGVPQKPLSPTLTATAPGPDWGNGGGMVNWGHQLQQQQQQQQHEPQQHEPQQPQAPPPDHLLSKLNLDAPHTQSSEEAWVERVAAAAGAIGRGGSASASAKQPKPKPLLDTEAQPYCGGVLPVKTPEVQEVNLPKLGSDLGVGSATNLHTALTLKVAAGDDTTAEAVNGGGGNDHQPRLPSKLGFDLGNDELQINAAQKLMPNPGAPYQDLPSPGSPSMLGRQWSAQSRDGRSDSVHFVPSSDVKVLAKIGEGAFGEVSLATVPIFGKVAVKWLKPKKLTTHNQAFWQEAELLGTLNHPHVIRFFGVVVESPNSQQVVGIITEYLAGGSLSALLHTPEGLPPRPPLPMHQRAELALGAANGMSYLHELRVVHFDLKPDNLLVDGDLSSANAAVKVADFGLSKHKYTSYVTGCRDLRGTLPYMAPELISDPDHVTEKADVWSMGIVLWELAARQVPYANMSPQQIVAGLMQGFLRPEIPYWVEDEWRILIESCLDFDPQARPSFRELSSKLERVRDEAAFLVTC